MHKKQTFAVVKAEHYRRTVQLKYFNCLLLKHRRPSTRKYSLLHIVHNSKLS